MRFSEKNVAVLGAQIGDEAKSRTVNYFAPEFNWIVRFSGSENAGHTLYHNNKKIIRHLIPSADFTTNNKAFLGAGMVINLDSLLSEVKETEEMFNGAVSKIVVDPDGFVITEAHIQEDKENVKNIGSTGKGVTPSYRDKINRKGTKIAHLIRDNAEIIKALQTLGVQFSYVSELMNEFEHSKILFEGAQSILLDFNFAPYPYCTSGEAGLNGIINSGFVKFLPSKIYGICKAYLTKVGNGNMPTEIFGSEAEKIREIGAEYGSTTKRPRRIGFLDLPMINYSIEKSGINALIFTKFDILDNYGDVPICDSYEKYPVSGADFQNAKPHYTSVKGWKNSRDITQLQDFIQFVEDRVPAKIEYVSCGVNKEDMIKVA